MTHAPACANNLLHQYIHSEPTIHQPRPPERRIDRRKGESRGAPFLLYL